jgi:hypothetical protein
MNFPSSGSVALVPTSSNLATYNLRQGVYMANDLRRGSNNISWFMTNKDGSRENPDFPYTRETSLGKLASYNNETPYKGYITWANNITGQGSRATATTEVKMSDLANMTVTTCITSSEVNIALVRNFGSASIMDFQPASAGMASFLSSSNQYTGFFSMVGITSNDINSRPDLLVLTYLQTGSGYNGVTANTVTGSISFGNPLSLNSKNWNLGFNSLNGIVAQGTTQVAISPPESKLGWMRTGDWAGVLSVPAFEYGGLAYWISDTDNRRPYAIGYLYSGSGATSANVSIRTSGSATALLTAGVSASIKSSPTIPNVGPIIIDGGGSPITTRQPYTGVVLTTVGDGWRARQIMFTGSAIYTSSAPLLVANGFPLNWNNPSGTDVCVDSTNNWGVVIAGNNNPGATTSSADSLVWLTTLIGDYQQANKASGSQFIANPGAYANWDITVADGYTNQNVFGVGGQTKYKAKAIENIDISYDALTWGVTSSNNNSLFLTAVATTASTINLNLFTWSSSSRNFTSIDSITNVVGTIVNADQRITLSYCGTGGNAEGSNSAPPTYLVFNSSSFQPSYPPAGRITPNVKHDHYVMLGFTDTSNNYNTTYVHIRTYPSSSYIVAQTPEIIGTASGLAENFNLAPSVQGLVPKMNGGIGYLNQYAGNNNTGVTLGNQLTEVGFQDAYTSFLGSANIRLEAYTPIMPVIYKDTGSIYVKMAGLY